MGEPHENEVSDTGHDGKAERFEPVAQPGQPHRIVIARRRDVRDIMAVSDIVLNLSREPEGFGRTTVEALSLGRPVIGYEHSGIAEVLGRAFPQGLVRTGDLSQLTMKVMAFLETPPSVPPKQPYTLQAMLDSTLDLYQAASAGE